MPLPSLMPFSIAVVVAAPIALPAVAQAQSARDLLVQAAFEDRSKPVALARIERARALALAAVARNDDDQDATIVAATALGYHAKLTGNRGEAVLARKAFEAAVARFPRNAEANVALGAWHIGVIVTYGRIVGRAAVGAQKGVGLAALDRAVALGGNRAMFPGLAALLRLESDPADERGRGLAEQASRAATPTNVDRYMQRAAAAVLAQVRAGNDKQVRALADRLLPLGWAS